MIDDKINSCPLCEVWHREPENVFYEDDRFVVIQTKYLKGHEQRVMVLSKEHKAYHNGGDDFLERWYMDTLIDDVIKPLFDYTYKIVVMEGKYGSVKDHWHVVITDLEPTANDIHQILGTPWIKVVDIKPWK